MKDEKVGRKVLPPYLPYRTFRNFMDSLLVGGIPGRIDRSLMGSMSGTTQSQLIATVRYLGLVSAHGVPTERLNRLVNSEGPERQKVLREILTSAYSFLFEEGFVLQKATAKQLEEQFAKAGASGETVRKCVTFFTAAAKAAGLPISPYIVRIRGGRGSQRSRRSSLAPQVHTSTSRPEGEFISQQQAEAIGWTQLLLSKFPSFDPAWPDEVKSKWFDAFDRLMQTGPEGK